MHHFHRAIVGLVFASLLCATSRPIKAQSPAPSTRDLYTYHRDDAAAVTTIHVNAAHVGATPISPDVFGNFIEHLGDVVYRTLWADALMNPNLERGEPSQTQPPYWDQAGTASWQEDGGYLSTRCVRLSGPDGTLSQRLYLPVQRTRRYTLTFYARAQQGDGQITVSVRVGGDVNGRAVLQTVMSVSGASWRKQVVHWEIPQGALAKGQEARFVVAHSGGPAVDVDQIELFPDDAVDSMDPDALKLAQAWHIPVLRLAGNFSSGYHWRDGVGPRLSRPTYRNPAWNGLETNQFGTDEFLGLSLRIGSTPQIAANAGNGTAQEAADWVRYCNAKSERVPIWEIGNELYGGWQIGHTDAPGNAARFVQFRDAMLQADPRLKLIATGKGEEFLPAGLLRDRDWNVAVLKAAVANNGQAPDWLSIHPLVGLPGGLGGLPYDQRWESAMAHSAFMDQTEIPQLIEQITSVEGPNARTRIAPTEWGLILGGDGWQDGPNHNNEGGAVYNALTLNAYLRHSDWLTLANVTALLHGGCIAKSHGVPYVMPEYYVNQLYSLADPRLPVETDTTGPGTDVPQRGFLPAATDVPDVDVFSALTADRKRLVLFAINRRLSDARPVKIDTDGFPIARVSATIVTAPDPQAGNSWDHPDTVAPHPFALSPGGARDGLTVSVPPHSLVVFTLTRR